MLYTKLRLVYQESSTGGLNYIVRARMAERKVDVGGGGGVYCRLQPKIGTMLVYKIICEVYSELLIHTTSRFGGQENTLSD